MYVSGTKFLCSEVIAPVKSEVDDICLYIINFEDLTNPQPYVDEPASNHRLSKSCQNLGFIFRSPRNYFTFYSDHALRAPTIGVRICCLVTLHKDTPDPLDRIQMRLVRLVGTHMGFRHTEVPHGYNQMVLGLAVDRARQSFRQSLRMPLRGRGLRFAQSRHLTPPTAEEGDEEDPVRARSMDQRRLTNEPTTTTIIENERLRQPDPSSISPASIHPGNNHVPAPIASPEKVGLH
ncbi:hypothetical protein J6590_008008 [Homalodisca vitripennis]|nr:hypothetical protein J6590_008008 [Homalodisca vitripennis]